MNTLEEHLKFCNFEKYLKKLVKKLQGKTILVYGTGSMFQYIQKNYDLSGLNIVAVSDGKYLLEQEGQEDLGYKIIPKEKLEEYDVDVVLLGLQNYIGVLCNFSSEVYKNKNTKIYPLVRIPLWKCLKDIWFS